MTTAAESEYAEYVAWAEENLDPNMDETEARAAYAAWLAETHG